MKLEHPLITALFSAIEKHPELRPEFINQIKMITLDCANDWLKIIDESPYAIDDWIQSLIVFALWAREANRELTLNHMFEYLSCCTASAQNGIRLPLPYLLSEFIRVNGVD